MVTAEILISEGWKDYRLIDTGEGRRLEQFGPYLVDRPEPQAMWRKNNAGLWKKADAVFFSGSDGESGRWKFSKEADLPPYDTGYRDVRFKGRFTPFRHLGFFPEQQANWEWMVSTIKKQKTKTMLNLFGYTGVASLLAAKEGVFVTHVDASQKSVKAGQENQKLSGMENSKIRWLVDDALKFVQREVRRGNTYDGVLLDPPKFGHGPKGETWDFFTHLPLLLTEIKKILNPEKHFVILTSYAIRMSFLSLNSLCQSIFTESKVVGGELALREDAPLNARMIGTSMYTFVVKGK